MEVSFDGQDVNSMNNTYIIMDVYVDCKKLVLFQVKGAPLRYMILEPIMFFTMPMIHTSISFSIQSKLGYHEPTF